MQTARSHIKALAFDVFGTVVDWYSSIVAEGTAFGDTHGIDIDWRQFALKWRAGYGPAMDRVRRGELPWQNIDSLHRGILDDLLEEFNIEALSETDKDYLNRVWHRLRPWPDAISGLKRLRQQYILATLSNGNVALLTNMAKFAGLPWDCILSAELTQHYKPDREVYETAAALLGLSPNAVMMVAAHPGDLRAAAAVGFQTALVPRLPIRKLQKGSKPPSSVFKRRWCRAPWNTDLIISDLWTRTSPTSWRRTLTNSRTA